MKRRSFLKYTAPLSMTPFVLNGTPFKTFATPSMLSLMNCEEVADRVLVLVQIRGGNDGLNTIVPLEQYDEYEGLRPTIRLSDTALINLDEGLGLEHQIGLHPVLGDFKNLYETGKMNIVQGVSYVNQNKSHFQSTDIWLTGGDGTTQYSNLNTGWMGRYLTHVYPGLAGNPTPLMPDPLGIQLGNKKPSLGFHSEEEHAAAINISGQDPSGFYTLISEIGGLPPENIPASEYGDELQYIINVENSTSVYAQRISEVFDNGMNSNSVTYPDVDLADQLKTVARLIQGGSKTKIYLVDIGGFDTHVNQVNTPDTTTGAHASLLTELGQSIAAFQADLQALGLEDKVLTVSFSEFGRKAAQNGSTGTDHGTLAPMFVFGSAVNAGITGVNVSLQAEDLAENGTQLQGAQFDYRQIYTTILQDWLGVDDNGLLASFYENFDKVNLIDAMAIVSPECYGVVLPITLKWFKAAAIDNKKVHLTWETSSEHNNKYFEIERSQDGDKFYSILQVESQGESDTPRFYETFDTAPLTGLSYYRLKQVDRNGLKSYFDVQTVTIKGEQISKVKTYPNPAIYSAYVTWTATQSAKTTIRLLNTKGQLVDVFSMTAEEGFNKFKIDVRRLAKGQYFVHIEGAGQLKEVTTLIVA